MLWSLVGCLFHRQSLHEKAVLDTAPVPAYSASTEMAQSSQRGTDGAGVGKSSKIGPTREPFEKQEWVESTAQSLGLESSLRPQGRPQVRFAKLKTTDEA